MARKIRKTESKKPKTLKDFESDFPEVWKAYTYLRDSCDHQNGLDPKTRELIKIAVETAFRRHGGLIAHMHRAQKTGATKQEIDHAILVTLPLIGMPSVLDAFMIAQDALET